MNIRNTRLGMASTLAKERNRSWRGIAMNSAIANMAKSIHHFSHQEGMKMVMNNQDGTGNECLLDGLVDEINLAMNDGVGDYWQVAEQALNLSGHPAHALPLEIVLIADFFVENMNVWSIFDKYLLLKQ